MRSELEEPLPDRTLKPTAARAWAPVLDNTDGPIRA
jgi:hypothetical protein